jgi:predicted membrane protein
MEELTTQQKLRKLFINKYTIILFLFAIIYIFIGDSSLIKRLKKAKKINAVENEIERVNKQIEKTDNILNSLDNKDSLERFAREEYNMHEEGEEVYLVTP